MSFKRILINLVNGDLLEFESKRYDIARGIDGVGLTDKLDKNFIFIPMSSVLFYEISEVEE